MKTRIERFAEKYEVDENVGCWLWTAGKTNGYGVFWDGEKVVLAHRWGYEFYRGPLPVWVPGKSPECDHLCREPTCVNPWHLEAVSRAENIRRGDKRALLNRAQVREIRKRYTGTRGEQKAMAREYGVPKQVIHRIVHKASWPEI